VAAIVFGNASEKGAIAHLRPQLTVERAGPIYFQQIRQSPLALCTAAIT
jgi:hypothetical protein